AINDLQPAQSTATASTNDDISEDEFEALLDQLHGQGKAPGINAATEKTSPALAQSVAVPATDDITDDEFEALLDQLHGTGKGPGTASRQTPEKPQGKGASESASAAASTPVKPAAKPGANSATKSENKPAT